MNAGLVYFSEMNKQTNFRWHIKRDYFTGKTSDFQSEVRSSILLSRSSDLRTDERGSPKGRPAPRMYTVYVLQSLIDGRTYVGYTNNFHRRFTQHNSQTSKATKYRAPFKLILKEEFNSSIEAKRREAWWKSGAGRRKMKELFEKLNNE